ncbi:MAG: hypothetical protein ACLQU1_18855 [Bryobacteraceae bacterium]
MRWTPKSEIERPGFDRAFTAVGKTLADVKEFAALVRWCGRTGKLEQMYPKAKYRWTKDVVAKNAGEEAALGGGWAGTPAAFAANRGPRQVLD